MKPGSIVLFHNAALNTPAALPSILKQLQSDGYKIVPISEILLKGPTTIDHKGQQHSAIKSESKTSPIESSDTRGDMSSLQ